MPEERDDETIAIVDDFGSFKRKISRVFVDIDAERTAERHLQNLRQLKSAATYAAEFQQHAGRADWNYEPLTAQFYRELKDSVKDDICWGEQPLEPQAMISAAIRIDNRLFERGLERRGQDAGLQGKKQGKQRDYWPQPMELEAAFKKRLSKEEMRRRKEKKLCFECGKEGHEAKFHR